VDNLPVNLTLFLRNCTPRAKATLRARPCCDARERHARKLPPAPEHLKKDPSHHACFIEANEDALLRRYSETRARIPWEEFFRTGKFVCTKRALMEPIASLRTWSLKPRNSTCMNWPLRHGAIQEFRTSGRCCFGREVSGTLRSAVRCRPGSRRAILPNPHFVPRLRPFTGQHRKCGGISGRFRRPENSCGASEGLPPI